MTSKIKNARDHFSRSEIGTIYKGWEGRLRVALVYPNSYHVGMSNLGFQTVYRQINALSGILCERAFLPQERPSSSTGVKTIESRRPISHFDIVAFSISYENDFPNLLAILHQSGIPLAAGDRGGPHPLIIAGGVACFLNPEPLSMFIDCFLIGESEVLLQAFFDGYDPHAERDAALKDIARQVPGAYVPRFYTAAYDDEGFMTEFAPVGDVPEKIKRMRVPDLTNVSTCSTVITPHTTFEDTFLVEVSRGCPHGCRFCSAGFVYRPPRFRPVEQLDADVRSGLSETSKIGLVGAAISDHPGIQDLCGRFNREGICLSFSSLRADALTPELISVLQQSNVKTATIAPDAGSQRMRNVINKGMTEEDILSAAETLVAEGIPNLKLYFMVGLPTETMDDVDAIVTLCKQIKHRFLKSSRVRKRIGDITVSLNSFVPKPSTPFQWVAMDDIQSLKKKLRKVKDGLKKVANVRVHSDIPRWAYTQGLLSRGDRRVARILLLAHRNQGNWAATFKHTPVNPDFYVLRERPLDEVFPWDFIDQGVKKTFLAREYRRALKAFTSPVCQVENCTLCGMCKEKS